MIVTSATRGSARGLRRNTPDLPGSRVRNRGDGPPHPREGMVGELSIVALLIRKAPQNSASGGVVVHSIRILGPRSLVLIRRQLGVVEQIRCDNGLAATRQWLRLSRRCRPHLERSIVKQVEHAGEQKTRRPQFLVDEAPAEPTRVVDRA